MSELNQALLDKLVAIARRAGDAIMAVYEGVEGIDVDYKADNSPLTQADLAAHQLILKELPALLPGVPTLSEESELPPFEQRRLWHRYWLIDPLDGTKEFISRNGEFTVNIALIEDGCPVAGVVHVPPLGITYTGARGLGARKLTPSASTSIAVREIASSYTPEHPLAVVASRRHGSEELQIALTKLRQHFHHIDTVNMGSSLKLCLVAEGRADVYPRLAPTSEWDTAAAQAVVEAAGGMVVDADFHALRYNQKQDILNPHFYVVGDTQLDWQAILG